MLIVAIASLLAVVAIWIGYPVVVALLASLVVKRSPRAAGAGDPGTGVSNGRRVTVVIASVDSPEVIRARVEDALTTDYPPALLEVVVALDAGGTASSASLGEIDPRVRVVRGDAPGGKALSLNAAVRQANGEILVFSDTAQRFERSTIPRLVAALGDSRFGAVSGSLQIGRDGAPANLAERYWLFEKWLRLQEARLHSTVGVTGAVYAMRRECWHPLPAGLILDDVYVPMLLVLRGFRVGFEPTATAYDDRRFPPAQEFKRKARTLTGVVQLCVWLPAVMLPWRNPIWLQFLFHKLLRLATPYLLLVGGVSAAAWLASGAGITTPWVGTMLLLIMLALATLATAAVPRIRRAASMAFAMQVAVVRATVNGLRGHWDVWSR
ncbi:MAG: glycosyltransferase [Gemmatimonadaceae bacterium]|nr:glycosyltransferase [Gemmatimonadaceae bacterium]